MKQSADEIVEIVQKFLNRKNQSIIAIDGRCASGKTTLAAFLADQISCQVIHMDDFFLRPEQRTRERLEQPGGNVDYERFLAEILQPLSSGGEFSYRPYDCHSGSFREPVVVNKTKCIVIEGSYSCHPVLWKYYDLHIFLDVEQDRQMERIRRRNGDGAADVFASRWIPLEEHYFSVCKIKEKCELQYEI